MMTRIAGGLCCYAGRAIPASKIRSVNQTNHHQPLPREVYIRRRIVAVAAIIVVVGLLWWFIASLGSDDAQPTSASSTSPVVTSTQPDVTSPSEPPNQKREVQTAVSTTTGGGKTTCGVEDLQVVAKPGEATFAADQLPNFFAEITNPTQVNCVVNLSEDRLMFEVFALNNYGRVWADLDCNEPNVNGEVTIEPGQKVAYELKAWSRTTSAPGQCDNRQSVGAGAYLLYAHVGDNVSAPATFNVA